MGKVSKRAVRGPRRRGFEGPRADDPRVVRSRAAVIEAARTLFLSKGYARTTMEDIAALAGLTKRTVYNNYADKDVLFTQIVEEAIAYAEVFARGVREEFTGDITAATLRPALDNLAQRLALGIMRGEVIALRRLLIGEAREFPELAKQYFDRAPGLVLGALAAGFGHLARGGLLEVSDPRLAAAQFAYVVVGEPLDRAVLVDAIPTKERILTSAREGVATFMARYATAPRTRRLR